MARMTIPNAAAPAVSSQLRPSLPSQSKLHTARKAQNQTIPVRARGTGHQTLDGATAANEMASNTSGNTVELMAMVVTTLKSDRWTAHQRAARAETPNMAR